MFFSEAPMKNEVLSAAPVWMAPSANHEGLRFKDCAELPYKLLQHQSPALAQPHLARISGHSGPKDNIAQP